MTFIDALILIFLTAAGVVIGSGLFIAAAVGYGGRVYLDEKSQTKGLKHG